jgi:histidine decarboxylase
MGREGLKARAMNSLQLAEYLIQRLESLGIKAWRNHQAITVVFRKPSKELCTKWQLATEGEWSHIICMPGISKETLDRFVLDLEKELQMSEGMQ